jgi:hypothetical protein
VPSRLRSEVTLLRGLSRPASTLGDARIYQPDRRPKVEVLSDGRWCDGELHMWLRRDEGWWANVSWHSPGETARHAIVPAPRVRGAGSTDAAPPAA